MFADEIAMPQRNISITINKEIASNISEKCLKERKKKSNN